MLDSLKTSNSRILSATTVDNNSWNARQENKNASEGFKLLTLTFKGAGHGILSFDQIAKLS